MLFYNLSVGQALDPKASALSKSPEDCPLPMHCSACPWPQLGRHVGRWTCMLRVPLLPKPSSVWMRTNHSPFPRAQPLKLKSLQPPCRAGPAVLQRRESDIYGTGARPERQPSSPAATAAGPSMSSKPGLGVQSPGHQQPWGAHLEEGHPLHLLMTASSQKRFIKITDVCGEAESGPVWKRQAPPRLWEQKAAQPHGAISTEPHG